MQACHTNDPANHDRSNGRVYKIVYGDSKSSPVDLSKESDLELANQMLHRNDWYVRHSRRCLQERSTMRAIDGSAVARLKEMVVKEKDDTRRLRAAWALSCIGALDENTIARMLQDASEHVRAWAIQLGLEAKKPWITPNQLTRLAISDPSPVVRLYLASAAQRLPVQDRFPLLSALIAHAEDAKDHNLPLMIWYAAEPLADAGAAREKQARPASEGSFEVASNRAIELGLTASDTMPLIRDYMLRRIAASTKPGAIESLLDAIGKSQDESLQLSVLSAIRSGLKGQRQTAAPANWEKIDAKLANGSAAVKLQAESLGVTFGSERALQSVRVMVRSRTNSDKDRLDGLATLLAAKDPKLLPVLLELLQEKGLRSAALSGLAQFTDPKIASTVLDLYPQLTSSEKRIALNTLASRAEYAIALLEAMDSKRLASTDLSADIVRQLMNLKNDQVVGLVAKTWGTMRETPADKAKAIEDIKSLIKAKGPEPDLALGRSVYAKTCQQCHILFDAGGKIGPELTGSNRTNLDYLLSNIVDPSAVMAKEYQPTIILTDGRTVSGLIKAEDAISISLQTVNALEVIPVAEIEDRKLSEKSMMPEDQLRPFSEHELRSLIAYLGSSKQSPMLATTENVSEFFNGLDLRQWQGDMSLWSVENNELIGKSNGLSHNSFLVSNYLLSDFHLTVEVKLINDEGNSGIQFRSRVANEGMKGYQADIGPGWWGKLYEEEARGLLWDKSGEQHVNTGEWNKYEVRAEGSKIKTWLNGQLSVDLDDPDGDQQGVIGLQLHSGGATEVRFRNVELKLLEK
jgi:putative heme-binding domain-containing protein